MRSEGDVERLMLLEHRCIAVALLASMANETVGHFGLARSIITPDRLP